MPLIWGVPIGSIHMPRRTWFIILGSGVAGAGIGVVIYLYELLK